MQVFSPPHLPLASRDLASPEWMLGASRDGSNQYAGSDQLEAGHQISALIETSNAAAGTSSQQNVQLAGHAQMDFLQQRSTGAADSGGNNNHS